MGARSRSLDTDAPARHGPTDAGTAALYNSPWRKKAFRRCSDPSASFNRRSREHRWRSIWLRAR